MLRQYIVMTCGWKRGLVGDRLPRRRTIGRRDYYRGLGRRDCPRWGRDSGRRWDLDPRWDPRWDLDRRWDPRWDPAHHWDLAPRCEPAHHWDLDPRWDPSHHWDLAPRYEPAHHWDPLWDSAPRCDPTPYGADRIYPHNLGRVYPYYDGRFPYSAGKVHSYGSAGYPYYGTYPHYGNFVPQDAYHDTIDPYNIGTIYPHYDVYDPYC